MPSRGKNARGFTPGPHQGRCPWTLRRAFGPLDSQAGIPAQGFTLAGVTARDRRAVTRSLRLAAAAAERVPRLRTRAEGFAVALCTPSQHPTGCFGREPVTLFRRLHLPYPPSGGREGFQRAIAKPFGRVRSRETPRSRFRVAARLSRAVTPARGKRMCRAPRMGVERAEGPSQESRGQRPLVGSRGKAPGGVPQGAAPLGPVTLPETLCSSVRRRRRGRGRR